MFYIYKNAINTCFGITLAKQWQIKNYKGSNKIEMENRTIIPIAKILHKSLQYEKDMKKVISELQICIQQNNSFPS